MANRVPIVLKSGELQQLASGDKAVDPAGAPYFATGTTTNDNAAAGAIGEYIEQVIPFGSPVTLVSNTAKTIASIALTAGDWHVWGAIVFQFTSTTSITAEIASLSNVNNGLPFETSYQYKHAAIVPGAAFPFAYNVPMLRVSLAASATYYLVALAVFTVSTCGGSGFIAARRMR